MKGIMKKNLSLDRGWNELTWTQKSSCYERLKLLKDDGVDITLLKGPKLNSPEITRAVVVQVNARKRRSSSQDVPHPTTNDRMDTSGTGEGVEEAALTPASNPAIVHENNRALSTSPGKRARDDTPEVEVSCSLPKLIEPPRKKVCRTDLRIKQNIEEMTQEELIINWGILKRQVLTDIFMSHPSTAQDTSRIAIAFPSQSAKVDVPGDLELKSRGYDKIMEELYVLSDGMDEDGNFELRHKKTSIRIITNVPLRTIIHGPFRAVMGLLGRLQQPGKGLVHMAKRYFDDAGGRQAVGVVYELSDETQHQVGQIGEALTEGQNAGNAEIQVRWMLDPVKTVPWPTKLY